MTTSQTSGSTQNNASSPHRPYAVPAHIRTNRVLPRIGAGLIVLAALAVFAYGTLVLREQEAQNRTPVDQLFAQGRTYWLGRLHSRPLECMAYIETHFMPPGRTEQESGKGNFSLNGALRYLLSGRQHQASFSLELGFDELMRLVTAKATLETQGSSLLLNLPPGEQKGVLALRAANSVREFSFDAPEAIYLVDRGGGRYSLRFPQAWQSMFEQRRDAAPRLDFYLDPAGAAGFAECRARVDGRQFANESLIDLGNYSVFEMETLQKAVGAILNRTGPGRND